MIGKQAPPESEEASSGFELRITGRAIRRALLGLLGAAVTLALVYFGLILFGSRDGFGGFVHEKGYQAVSLADGRVYFGHLRERSRSVWQHSRGPFRSTDQRYAPGAVE